MVDPIYRSNTLTSKSLQPEVNLLKNKNLYLLQSIRNIKEKINSIKYHISKLSNPNNSKKLDLISDIVKKIGQENINIKSKNEKLKKEIFNCKKTYENISDLYKANSEQISYVKITAEEQNFILENKLKEKNNLIEAIKFNLSELNFGIKKFELIREIDSEYYNEEGGFDREVGKIIREQSILGNQYLLGNLIKENRLINNNKKLLNEKNDLEEIIKNYKNYINNNNPQKNPEIQTEEKDVNINNNNETMIQTKVSTDDSYINNNEDYSLSLDSEEELDIEFSSTNLLSSDLIKKNPENKSNNHINIPHLDLRMINYNKSHIYSYSEKSLSRNLKFVSSDNKDDSADIINENVKNMKNLIKSYKKKNKILQKKCDKYEGKIGKIALKLYSNKDEKNFIYRKCNYNYNYRYEIDNNDNNNYV